MEGREADRIRKWLSMRFGESPPGPLHSLDAHSVPYPPHAYLTLDPCRARIHTAFTGVQQTYVIWQVNARNPSVREYLNSSACLRRPCGKLQTENWIVIAHRYKSALSDSLPLQGELCVGWAHVMAKGFLLGMGYNKHAEFLSSEQRTKMTGIPHPIISNHKVSSYCIIIR